MDMLERSSEGQCHSKTIKKNSAIQRLSGIVADVANQDLPKLKYRVLANRLSEKVSMYNNEPDKLP